jgi:hypothetical protein
MFEPGKKIEAFAKKALAATLFTPLIRNATSMPTA